jgi:hypothetical protein
MPNWCENDVYLRGLDTAVLALLEAVKSTESAFDFDKIIPMPAELQDIKSPNDMERDIFFDGPIEKYLGYPWVQTAGVTDRAGLQKLILSRDPEAKLVAESAQAALLKYGTTDWYDWATKNWGTKWNASQVRVQEAQPRIRFSTAWSPPLEVFDVLAKQHSEVTIELRYFERGMEFKGIRVYKKGVVTKDTQEPYKGQRGG